MNYTPNFFITGASVNDGKVVLEVSGTPAVNDFLTYRFLFASNVIVPSEATQDSELVLSFGEKQYPLWNKFGMPLKISETATLKGNDGNSYFAPRSPIYTGIGTVDEKPHFSVWNLPRPSAIIIPIE